MIEGVFLLSILFTDEPKMDVWNPQGPFEFSSYKDCNTAGNVISGLIHKNHTVTCTKKDTGEIYSSWTLGPSEK